MVAMLAVLSAGMWVDSMAVSTVVNLVELTVAWKAVKRVVLSVELTVEMMVVW